MYAVRSRLDKRVSKRPRQAASYVGIRQSKAKTPALLFRALKCPGTMLDGVQSKLLFNAFSNKKADLHLNKGDVREVLESCLLQVWNCDVKIVPVYRDLLW